MLFLSRCNWIIPTTFFFLLIEQIVSESCAAHDVCLHDEQAPALLTALNVPTHNTDPVQQVNNIMSVVMKCIAPCLSHSITNAQTNARQSALRRRFSELTPRLRAKRQVPRVSDLSQCVQRASGAASSTEFMTRCAQIKNFDTTDLNEDLSFRDRLIRDKRATNRQWTSDRFLVDDLLIRFSLHGRQLVQRACPAQASQVLNCVKINTTGRFVIDNRQNQHQVQKEFCTVRPKCDIHYDICVADRQLADFVQINNQLDQLTNVCECRNELQSYMQSCRPFNAARTSSRINQSIDYAKLNNCTLIRQHEQRHKHNQLFTPEYSYEHFTRKNDFCSGLYKPDVDLLTMTFLRVLRGQLSLQSTTVSTG